ncbi:MAG: hypothetical protein KF796_19270 [Ramlibacter sp.]|nr:hypothetical protein [Ramlibacter sp.]
MNPLILLRLQMLARLGGVALVVAAVWYGYHAFTEHFMDLGAARVQDQWDREKQVTLAAAREQEEAYRNEENRQRINAERIADEHARIDADRARRLAAASGLALQLRDALAKLDARDRDLSAGATDARVATLVARATAARELFGRCAERYQRMAGEAERIRDQAAGLLDDALTVCRSTRNASTPDGEPGLRIPTNQQP